MKDSMVELVEEFQLIPPGSTILCAVSGGADSIYLLHRLARLRGTLGFSLIAVHYDHMLRGEESRRDGEFVRQFIQLCCGSSLHESPPLPEVPLIVGRGDVAVQAELEKRGMEETARTMRYAFFRQVAAEYKAYAIATAHNANDNLETLLFHLGRGAGLRGMCGISPKSQDLIRPLLTTSRQEIEDYLRFWGLPWREDCSNRDQSYTRNRLRHQVLPVLESVMPGFLAQATKGMERLRRDESYLEGQAKALEQQIHQEDGMVSIPVEVLNSLPQPLALRVIRQMLGRLNQGDDGCTTAHLEGVWKLCDSDSPSARLSLPRGVVVQRMYERLVLHNRQLRPLTACILPTPGKVQVGDWLVTCQSVAYQGEQSGTSQVYLPQGCVSVLQVRSRQTGDAMALPNRPKKTLKKWMIEEKIPASIRDYLPVLEGDGQVLAVPLLGAAPFCQPKKGELVWHIEWKPLSPLLCIKS